MKLVFLFIPNHRILRFLLNLGILVLVVAVIEVAAFDMVSECIRTLVQHIDEL